jgi:pyruvate/2-oxoglutarate dehydrogenase complex dihydrolipoamide acyltransferase (E2) component
LLGVIDCRDAVREAIRDALRRDERVFLMGEDVGRYGGCYAVSKGLLAEFGPGGVEKLYGIIYPPQVAIIGFGKIVTRPWVIDGAIEPRSVVTITLAADHRVSDGHVGGLFLAEIGRLLQEPDKL